MQLWRTCMQVPHVRLRHEGRKRVLTNPCGWTLKTLAPDPACVCAFCVSTSPKHCPVCVYTRRSVPVHNAAVLLEVCHPPFQALGSEASQGRGHWLPDLHLGALPTVVACRQGACLLLRCVSAACTGACRVSRADESVGLVPSGLCVAQAHEQRPQQRPESHTRACAAAAVPQAGAPL